MPRKEMDVQTVKYDKDMSKMRFDLAWESAKKKWKDLGIGGTPSNFNLDSWAKLVAGSNKELLVKIVLTDQKSIKIEASSGGKTHIPYDMALSTGDITKWRDEMAKLATYSSSLVTSGELSAFNTAHPDPGVLAKIKKDLETMKKEREDLKKSLDAKDALIVAKQKEYKDAGGR